jgi:hypothetical protein
LLPGVVGVKEQPPAATVPVQLAVASVTVTFPVGVPLPGATVATVKVTATAWPTTEGSGVWLAIVVAVLARLTVWATAGDVLVVKFASPAYVAVRFFAPAEVGVSVQVPAATVPTQVAVPSLAVTFPVGVPPPGATAPTVKVTVTAWPTTEGSGVWLAIVVAVPAWFTVCATPDDVLVVKLASPAYVATRFFVPAVVGVSVQVPVATVPLQLAVPSLTFTLPVGVPPAEVTVKLTATPWPTTDGFGVCVVIDVVVPAGLTVTVAVCVIATPLIVAETVLDPAAVELRVPVATPVPSVVAAGCVRVFPVVGAAASATVAPPIGFPFPSRAVTVIVEVPVPTVIGDVAVTVD